MANVDERPVEKKVSKYIATYKTVIETSWDSLRERLIQIR